MPAGTATGKILEDLDVLERKVDTLINLVETLEATAVPASEPPPIYHPTGDAIVLDRGLNYSSNQEDIDPSQNGLPATDETYEPVIFEAEMFSRTKFLIVPSSFRHGHTNCVYARVMRLEEAQTPETFRFGALGRLREMGEAVIPSKLVVKPEWMPVPFVVDSDYDHYCLLELVKAWGEWKAPSLCTVYISLIHDAQR